MSKMCDFITGCLEKLGCFSSLFFRLVLAYGFYEPAMRKLTNIEATAQWFTEMHYIYPLEMAWTAGIVEGLGVIMLFLGLGTRLISLPLMVMMIVAIVTVHWDAGFTTSGGFTIPLYFLLMLFSLFTRGAGGISLDAYFCKSSCNKE